MVNTATQQSTPVLLFFLIFKWTACKLTLSHFCSQFQWSKWKQILTIECAILEDRHLLLWTTDLHQGTRSTELTKFIAAFSTICCFLLPKTLKVSWCWGMNKHFMSGCLPGCAYKPAVHKCYLPIIVPAPWKLYVISQNGFQICNQRKKNTLKSPNFTMGQISLLSGVIDDDRWGAQCKEGQGAFNYQTSPCISNWI